MSDEEIKNFPEDENKPENNYGLENDNNDDMMYVGDYDGDNPEDEYLQDGNQEPLYGGAEYNKTKGPDEIKYEIHERESEKTNRGLVTTILVIILIVVLSALALLSLKNVMPGFLLNRADRYMEKAEYQKALNLYTIVSNARPLEVRPVIGQVMALAKLPMTYENQKLLYEISQLDDYDEATELAEKVLDVVRKELNERIGSSFIDNVLFEGQLLRWNKSQPITYSVGYNDNVPDYLRDAVKEAFGSWSNAMNGEIMFKETPGNPNTNIIVHFSAPEKREEYQYAFRGVASIPEIVNAEELKKVDIYLSPLDREDNFLDYNNMYNISLHQIGHALGMWGHSAHDGDLMAVVHEQPYPDAQMHVLTTRDINTLKAIYNMVPDVIDIPLKRDEIHTMNYHRILTTYPGENYIRETERIISQLKFNKRSLINWVDLAISYARMKQYERSNYILKNLAPLIVDDYANQFVIFYNMAANYYKLKKYDSSRRYLEYAREIENDYDVRVLDAFLDYKDGNLELAREELKDLIKEDPENVEVALKLAEIYFVRQDKKAEQAVIDELIRNNPDAKKDRRVAKYKLNKDKAVEDERRAQITNEDPAANKNNNNNNYNNQQQYSSQPQNTNPDENPVVINETPQAEDWNNQNQNPQPEDWNNQNQNPQPEDWNNQNQ